MWILDGIRSEKDTDKLAIVERSGVCTYRDIWMRSEKIAREILKRVSDSGKDTPVVIYGDKHPDMIPVMIAALKTGRAYVPVDISYPVERLEYIAQAVDTCMIYDFSGRDPKVPFLVRDGFRLRSDLDPLPVQEDLSESYYVKEEDDCYILFTSGSTGKPKGVPITKANLLNFANWFIEVRKPEQCGSNVLNQASYSFDVSVEILYVYLTLGKTLICVDKGLSEDIGALVDWLSENEVSFWSSTPSFLDLCRKNPAFTSERLPKLRTFIVGGEVFTKQTALAVMERFPEAVIVNSYGPTEATVEFTMCEITREMIEDTKTLPIGAPMAEALTFVSDEDLAPLPDETVGELIVVSRSVARGYYQDPERTERSFFTWRDGRRGFRTGDLVYKKDGLYYFVGRRDFQVKLNGYRIEIEDIVNHLDELTAVEASAVVPGYDADGKVEHLTAFVVLKKEYCGKPRVSMIAQIKKELKEQVPSYMIPRKIIFMENLPMNTNGKIDRKRLEALA